MLWFIGLIIWFIGFVWWIKEISSDYASGVNTVWYAIGVMWLGSILQWVDILT